MRKPKSKKREKQVMNDDVFFDRQSEKLDRFQKKLKRNKPPHRTWQD